jgi:hypothetical protein
MGMLRRMASCIVDVVIGAVSGNWKYRRNLAESGSLAEQPAIDNNKHERAKVISRRRVFMQTEYQSEGLRSL